MNEATEVWSKLDLRSLALFRVLLGSFVLIDLLLRLSDLEAFYTDSGVLTRSALVASPLANFWLSFHLGTGSTFGQAILFLIGMGFSIGLIAGWRTQWMILGCWVMTNSLQARNPFVNDRGDLELVLMLFWGFFLPLGARYSLDAKSGRKPQGSNRGLAPAALVIQFASIYVFTALYKYGDFWLARGDGLKFSLISPLFSTQLSLWLAENGGNLLYGLNYAVVAGELFLGLLLLLPFQVTTMRMAAVFCAMVFHLSVACLFKLGLFPFIGALLPLALLPSEFWDSLASSWPKLARLPVESSELKLAKPVSAFLAGCLLLAICSNLSFRSDQPNRWRPPGFATLAQALRLEQHWELFSPTPPYFGSFKLSQIQPDGRQLILFEGPSRQDKSGLQDFPNHRWRMLMITSLYHPFRVIRPGLVERLAKRYREPGVSPSGQLNYQFDVRKVNKKGTLEPAETWLLYRKLPAPKAKTPPNAQSPHNHHHGHKH